MHSCPVCGNPCDCDGVEVPDELDETLPPDDCDHCDDDDEDGKDGEDGDD